MKKTMARKLLQWQMKIPVKLLCFIISISFIIIQIISLLKLTNTSNSTKPTSLQIGEFGNSLINMLPDDLKFTLFLPSENAIQSVLRLKQNDSDSYAVLTRVLGFSAVPRWISSKDLSYDKEMVYDSLSGFKLYVLKELNGMVVVNGVVTEEIDLKMGKELIVHVMKGIVMDSEFEESMLLEDDEQQENLN